MKHELYKDSRAKNWQNGVLNYLSSEMTHLLWVTIYRPEQNNVAPTKLREKLGNAEKQVKYL